MDRAYTKRMIESGHWFEGDLGETLQFVREDWNAASENRGPWETTIDVADLTKILTELRERRAQDV